MLRTNCSHYAVLKPGYLRKSYRLASEVTRAAEKPLTSSETHCERRMSKRLLALLANLGGGVLPRACVLGGTRFGLNADPPGRLRTLRSAVVAA
jgi:hypothetical protein